MQRTQTEPFTKKAGNM